MRDEITCYTIMCPWNHFVHLHVHGFCKHSAKPPFKPETLLRDLGVLFYDATTQPTVVSPWGPMWGPAKTAKRSSLMVGQVTGSHSRAANHADRFKTSIPQRFPTENKIIGYWFLSCQIQSVLPVVSFYRKLATKSGQEKTRSVLMFFVVFFYLDGLRLDSTLLVDFVEPCKHTHKKNCFSFSITCDVKNSLFSFIIKVKTKRSVHNPLLKHC